MKERGARGPLAKTLQIGPWRVEPEAGRLVSEAEEVRLEPRVMDLLLCLASRPGEVISRQEIDAKVWADINVGYDSLASAMIKLRKALGDNSRQPQFVETVPKRGYRLIAEAVWLAEEETAPTVSSPPLGALSLSTPPPGEALHDIPPPSTPPPSTPPPSTPPPSTPPPSTPPPSTPPPSTPPPSTPPPSTPPPSTPPPSTPPLGEPLANTHLPSAPPPNEPLASDPPPSATTPPPVQSAHTAPASLARVPWRRWALAASLLVALASFFAVIRRPDDETSATGTNEAGASNAPAESNAADTIADGVETKNEERVSLVVLPFAGSEGDPVRAYFSDGITDDLINDLSLFSGLDVVARRSAYLYKDRHVDIETIARELNVQYLVDGDVRRLDDEIRLNVQLIDATTGKNLWARRFTGKAEANFELQDDIRANILRSLSVTLTEEERVQIAKRDTTSFAAYDLFLKGQAALVTRASAEDSRKAQRFIEEAISLDPGFARAYAALALIHADAYRFGWAEDPATTKQEALKIGLRAAELNDGSHQAWWILGYIYLFLFEDHDKSIEMATRATKLAPNDDDVATVLAVTYAFGDEPEKGKEIVSEIMKRSVRYSSLVPSVLGLADLRLGNLEESLKAYDRSLLINASRIQGNTYRAIVLYRMGDLEGAEFQVVQLYAHHPDFDLDLWAKRQPFKDEAIRQQYRDDLAHAGVEED